MKNMLLAGLLLGFSACGRSDLAEIKNFGSDTMLEVAGAWAEAYERVDPSVVISVSGGGSGTGISGIINGTVDIANCSRKMHPKEIEDAKKHGRDPVQHKVGYDGIAIYVHKENPIKKIDYEQLRGIFGQGGTITKWSQLGVEMPEGVSDQIVVVSRQNNSGTYEYFREDVLEKGNFRLGTRDMSGSKDVVDLVSKTPGAIGYSGLAYANDSVKMLPVSRRPADEPVAPRIETVVDGTYPISRPLFMYTDGQPKGRVKAYLDWILSDEGQKVLREKGYPPLR